MTERLTFWLTTKVIGIVALLAADRSRGKDHVAAEFAGDAVSGVGEGEVAEAVDGDAAGRVQRSAEGGVAVLGGAVGAGSAVRQTCRDGQRRRPEDVADYIVRTGLGDKERLCWREGETIGLIQGGREDCRSCRWSIARRRSYT